MTLSNVILAEIDVEGRLITSDQTLIDLQQACGGEAGGALAIPELRELVAKARQYRLRLARPFSTLTDTGRFGAWAEIDPPVGAAGPITIRITNWKVASAETVDDSVAERHRRDIERLLADATARLDDEQRLLSLEVEAADLAPFALRAAAAGRCLWTELVTLDNITPGEPLHWRLADGAICRIDGSDRRWRIGIEPAASSGSRGYFLYLTATQPLPEDDEDTANVGTPGLGSELAPSVRQPVERIVEQAQAIGAQLAGPLPAAYAAYAHDIAGAGEHLLGLLDDLADLGDVESEQFAPATEDVELADLARQACAMLAKRAAERQVTLVPPATQESLRAIADRRRVLQVLLNVVGNALRYGPPDSQVWIRLDTVGNRALTTIADQGRGLGPDEQRLVFEKFERLGRSGDGGSGLGLYISRRIARAMGGDLTVESAPGMGARFTLSLPVAPTAT